MRFSRDFVRTDRTRMRYRQLTFELMACAFCDSIAAIVFMEGHHFSAGENGLAFLGVGFGVTIGGLLTPVQTALYRRHGRKYPGPGGNPRPEARMLLPMLAAICLPVGIFWFAW